MPVKSDREYRAMAAMQPTADEYIVEGYATTYNDPYPLWGEVREQIASDALEGADLSDVIFQYDHDGMVMARNRNQTLTIESDATGIKIRADLSGSQAGRELYEGIKNGLVDRMSWAFTVAVQSFDYDTDLRTIEKVKKVYDVSAVSTPANDATSISARSYYDGVIEGKRLEQRKRKCKQIQITKELGHGQNEGNRDSSS